MSSFDAPMCALITITRLDVAVRIDPIDPIDPSEENMLTGTSFRPWLTLCLEPIAQIILGSVLESKPPGPASIHALLSQTLEHPCGRRLTGLWVDDAAAWMLLQQQALVQRGILTLNRAPLPSKGTSERSFHSLSLYLQARFPVASLREGNSTAPISLSQVEEAYRQWRSAPFS